MKTNHHLKTCLFLIVGTLTFSQPTFSAPITRQQAQQNVSEFLQGKGINVKRMAMRHAPMSQEAANAPYYVFNIGDDNGFVIAAGDDCAYEILGYSDKGNFDSDSIPDGMKSMLDFYTEQIEFCSKQSIATKVKSGKSYPAVEPMLTTTWGQRYPYNANCPFVPSSNTRCVTGCLATAMAQVMYYHRKNSTNEIIKEIPSYTTSSNKIEMGSISKGSPIDWDNILDDYGDTFTEDQEQAVANLMLYCGSSLRMDYGSSSGASASRVPDALVDYFDYDNSIYFKSRIYYTDLEWETMVYEELEKGYPILYGASSHAFVIDGHDGNGYVHINWGWNGSEDGFFLLTATPATEEPLDGYNVGQHAVFGAFPYDKYSRLTNQGLSLTSSNVIENLSSSSSIPVSFSMLVANLTKKTCSFQQAIGLYKDGQLQSIASVLPRISNMEMNTTQRQSVSFELESSLSQGIYTLVPLSKASGSSEWRKNANYEHYVTIAIYADRAKLTVGPPEKEEDIITFACPYVKSVCVRNWDTNGDNELSKEEAAVVNSLNGVFSDNWFITSFDELQFFTGLTTIGHSEFSNCVDLTSIIIPENVTTIGKYAFSATDLKQITIPKNVTSIDEDVFPSNLEIIRVDEGNSIYDSRNDGNAIIETATNTLIVGCKNTVIPHTVTSIGNYAFNRCTGLTSINIPEGLISIGESAFKGCTGLTSINIPEGLISIGKSSFSGCSGLSQVSIPFGVSDIGDFAFSSCTSLTSISIPSGVSNIGEYAFSSCSGLTSITIQPGVKNIGKAAFSYCSALTSITIPKSVISIGENPFRGCSHLTSIIVDKGNTHYSSINNSCTLIETTSNTLVVGCANTAIPESIVAIGGYAFYNCVGLESVSIPSNVTSIGDYAFCGCTGLTSITIPSSVISNGKCIFRDCTNLREITILDGITSIEDGAFWGCTGLTSITIPSSVKHIGYAAFEDCSGLMSFTIPSSVKSIGSWAFSGCSGLTSISIPSGVESIEERTFYKCSGLTTINIPESVTSIGYRAFYGCSGLKSVNIPNGVTSIGQSAFSGCTNLLSITIPNSIIEIGSYVLYDCPKLMLIEVKKAQPITIGNDVFSVETYNKATLCVPNGSMAAYKSADNWKRFSNIVDHYETISFADYGIKRICVENWDIDGDGELFEYELSQVKELGHVFGGYSHQDSYDSGNAPNEVRKKESPDYDLNTFHELRYFTGLTAIDNYEFEGSDIWAVSLPENLTKIGEFAFGNLLSIDIPKNVKSIGYKAFGNRLESIYVDPYNKWYDSRNDCDALIETATNTLIQGCKYTVIPDDIEIIGSEAFEDCELDSITIPKSVKEIGSYAFYGCENLSTVRVKWYQPVEIYEDVFYSSWWNYEIYDNATLYVPRGTKAAYQAATGWKNFSNIVEYGKLAGDVNGDGVVNITDVTMTVNHVLGNHAEAFDETVADMNDDGKINISDVSLIVGIVLSGQQ